MSFIHRLFTKSEITSRYKSYLFAVNGLKVFFTTQTNAKIEFFAALFATFLGFYFNLSVHEWAFIVIAIGLVFIAEIFNTSIEFLTDIVSPQYSKAAGKIKDIAAAGVLFAVIIALVLGALVFIPKFWEMDFTKTLFAK